MANTKIDPKFIRNIAVIAHVDHGKTTLIDAFLKQSNIFRENQEEMSQEMIMDSGELEREKGITIKAKNASIRFGEYKINIIDTPGHADFGGEVERTLNMADGCLLIVDAQEGPMPQTKFVLKKAFELGLKVILVINKIDKSYANPDRALHQVSDLFLNLAQNDDQLDFPTFYAIGREGKVWDKKPTDFNEPSDIKPLLEEVIKFVPQPKGDVNDKLQMQICSLEFDAHMGRLLVGRINRGSIKIGDNVTALYPFTNEKNTGKVKHILVKEGLAYTPVDEAGVGEIVAIAGIETTAIGGTLCDSTKLDPLPPIKISEPAVQVKFEANTSPLVGQEGKFVTAKQVQQRLDKEAEINIGLKITKTDGGGYIVAGRGELQLSILIETLRREGYEFQIRKPEVVLTQENGIDMEPREEVSIDVPEQYQGVVTTAMAERKGELQDLQIEGGQARFTYNILTRNLLGLRHELISLTKGNLVINNVVIDHVPYVPQPEMYRKGVLISMDNGIAMGYSLNTIQERGDLFIPGGTRVYEGMIIGINKFDQDLEVNPTKEREKSGVRMKHDEITQTSLRPLKQLTLDYAILFLKSDEMLEVTPQSLRLRKVFLTKTERDWSKRQNLTDFAKKQMGMG